MSKPMTPTMKAAVTKAGPVLPEASPPKRKAKASSLTLSARLDILVEMVRRDYISGVRDDHQIMADGRSIDRYLAGLFRQKCRSVDDVHAALIAAARMADTVPADQRMDDDVIGGPPGKVAYWAAREARRMHDKGDLRMAAAAGAASVDGAPDAALLADFDLMVRLQDEYEKTKISTRDEENALEERVCKPADQAETRIVEGRALTLAGVTVKLKTLSRFVACHFDKEEFVAKQVSGVLRDVEAMANLRPADTRSHALAALCEAALQACETLAPLDRLDLDGVDEQREAAMHAWDYAMRAVGDYPIASRADVMAKLELSARCLMLLGYKRGHRPAGSGSTDEIPWSCEMLEHAAMRDLAGLVRQRANPEPPKVAPSAATSLLMVDRAVAEAGKEAAFREGIRFAGSAAATEWAERVAADGHILRLVARHRRARNALAKWDDIPGGTPEADREEERDAIYEMDIADHLLFWSTPQTAETFLMVAAELQVGALGPKFPADGDAESKFAWAIGRMAREMTGAPGDTIYEPPAARRDTP